MSRKNKKKSSKKKAYQSVNQKYASFSSNRKRKLNAKILYFSLVTIFVLMLLLFVGGFSFSDPTGRGYMTVGFLFKGFLGIFIIGVVVYIMRKDMLKKKQS